MRLIDRSDAQQLAEVRRILDLGVPVNARFDAGGHDTPLTEAAGYGHSDIVRLLLERGANPNARNDEGETALWNAADAPLSESGDFTEEGPQEVTPAQHKAWTAAYVGIIRALLERKANPNLGNNSGVTPLGVAAYRGRTEEVAALLNGGANPNLRDHLGKTPLEWAAYNGNAAAVRLLQTHGARLGAGRTLPKAEQRTKDAALQNAVEENKVAAAKAWLTRGADPNALVSTDSSDSPPEMQGLTLPLQSASESPALTRLLLRAGANPNGIDDRGQTPLMAASAQVTRLLLARGAKVNTRDNDGQTALMAAVDDPAKVRLLLARGADVRAQDKEGRTALQFCTKVNVLEAGASPSTLEQLLARGADINHADHLGRTALMDAAQQGYGEGGVTCDATWARALLRHGADPNHRDHNGRTALMILAVPFGEPTGDDDYYDTDARVSFARMLLARGARRNLRDNQGSTALQLAKRSKAISLVRVLRSSR